VLQLWDPRSDSLSPCGCRSGGASSRPWVCPGVPRDLVSPPHHRLSITGSSSIPASRCPSTSGCWTSGPRWRIWNPSTRSFTTPSSGPS